MAVMLILHRLFAWALASSFSLSALPASSAQPVALPPAATDISFRHEVQRALDRGLAWLQTNQNAKGRWSTPDQPAVTALALTAFQGEPGGRYGNAQPDWMKKVDAT